jgi:oxalate decarboxylase/phosphoglucose isomerase-like protein (cupin superfamily)
VLCRRPCTPGISPYTEPKNSTTPGESIEELYILVFGTATMAVDGVDHEMQPGDDLLVKPGAEHDIRNTGHVPARVIVVWLPRVPVYWRQWASGRKVHAASISTGITSADTERA